MSRPDSVPVAKPAVAEISRSRLSTLSCLRIRVACRLTARGNVVSGSCRPKNGDDPPSDVSGGRATAEANPDEVVSSMASHTDLPPAAVDRDINGSTSFGDLKRQRERADSARPTIGLASASPPLPLLLERASKSAYQTFPRPVGDCDGSRIATTIRCRLKDHPIGRVVCDTPSISSRRRVRHRRAAVIAHTHPRLRRTQRWITRRSTSIW